MKRLCVRTVAVPGDVCDLHRFEWSFIVKHFKYNNRWDWESVNIKMGSLRTVPT